VYISGRKAMNFGRYGELYAELFLGGGNDRTAGLHLH
jgi:hypothetical protein